MPVSTSTRTYFLTACALAVLLPVGTGGALAQSGISSGGPTGVQSLADGPKGIGHSRMPLADLSAVPVGGRSRTSAPIPGRRGSSAAPGDVMSPNAFGTGSERWPFTVSRVQVQDLGPSTTVSRTPVTSRPYRLTGKLWARFTASSGLSPGWYVCTASLIKKSLLVTAAHCVHNFGHGQNGFAVEVLWYPANIKELDRLVGALWRVRRAEMVRRDVVSQRNRHLRGRRDRRGLQQRRGGCRPATPRR